MNRIASGMVIAMLTLLPSIALAATRTVCFNRVVVEDTRVDCPSSTATGANIRNRCGSADNERAALGFRVELWDADTTPADDDLIGTWVISGLSPCFTFEWENAAYFENETNGPDAYITFKISVRKSDGSGWIVTARGGTGAATADLAVRGVASNNCATNGTGCTVTTEVKPATGGGSAAQRQQMLLTAQYGVQLFNSQLDRNVDLWYPNTEVACATGCAWNRSLIKIPSTLATNGSTISHEFGHVWQYVQFTQDNFLVDDCSANGGGWSIIPGTETFEHQSCTTTEGFATYAAATVWYDPNNTTAPTAVPIVWGQDLEDAVPRDATCSNNAFLPRQAAKAFWDLDDATNEAGTGVAGSNDDTSSWSTTSPVGKWNLFADGTANRENDEADAHGVNLQDYRANSGLTATSANWISMALHNCMGSQDDN